MQSPPFSRGQGNLFRLSQPSMQSDMRTARSMQGYSLHPLCKDLLRESGTSGQPHFGLENCRYA